MGRKKGPQVQQAYDYIKEKILSFELPPGVPVSDRALEQELDMSRSPIREAIINLVAHGLLEVTPTGTQVASLTIDDIIELCQVRKAVEVAAINIIMDHGGLTRPQKTRLTEIHKKLQTTTNPTENYHWDDLFHSQIMDSANNRRLVSISDQIRLQIYRARWLHYMMPSRLELAAREHANIYEALMSNDRQKSIESMEAHLDRSEQGFRQVLESPRYSPQFSVAMGQVASMHKSRADDLPDPDHPLDPESSEKG